MGREARCTARHAGKTSAGKALLETAELLFRGDFRVVVPFKDMTKVSADATQLTVVWSGGTLALDLGPEAARWAQRIRNPPSRLDKLGVKPTSVVAMLKPTPTPTPAGARASDDAELDAFAAELSQCGAKVVPGMAKASIGVAVDIVFLVVDRRADLRALAPLPRTMRDDAAVWILRPKGSDQVSESDVRAAARGAGLVDVKVAAFSSARTAEKFVIPVAARGGKKSRDSHARR